MNRTRPSLLLGALALFVLLASAYTFSIGLRATRGASITGDEPFYLLTTQSLIADGDLDLRNQYVTQSYRAFFDHDQPLWMQSTPLADGRILSPHEPGLSLYLVPGFAVGGLLGAQVQMLLTAAATFALAYVLVVSEGGEEHRAGLTWLATLGVGLTATAVVYATELYPEVPAALCLILALLLLRRSTLEVRGAIGIALLVTALAWLGTKYIPLGALVALVALWRAYRPTRVWLTALCAASGAAYLVWHMAVFGGLTAYSTNAVYADSGTIEVVRAHLAIPDRAYRLVGLFVDERFGIGRWAPLLLVVLPALPMLLRRGALGALAVGLITTQVLIGTFVAITMMGWWFPGRTLVTVLPIMAWVVTEVLLRVPAYARVVVGALGMFSGLVTVALVRASGLGEVTIAVDPFALPATVFRGTSTLFPDYRAWSLDTMALHAAWSVAALAVLGLVLWSERNSRWLGWCTEQWRRLRPLATAAALGRSNAAQRRGVEG